MSEHIVFLLGSYYPNYSAVGRCQGNLAEELVKQGYQVTVIAVKGNISDAKEELYSGQRVIRVSTKEHTRDLLIKEGARQGRKVFLPLRGVRRISRTLSAVFSKDSLCSDYVEAYLKALRELVSQPDIIVSACMPFEAIWAGCEYKRQNPACRVVNILYDMFAESASLQRFAWNNKLKKKTNMQLEREAITTADRTLHMPSWTKYLHESYPDLAQKTLEIEHPLLKERKAESRMYQNGDRKNIVYSGVVDSKIRNPKSVLDFFCDAAFEGVKVHFYSTGSAQNMVDSIARGNSIIESNGWVKNKIANEAIYSADFLLSIGNSKGCNQIPSKIFEYMSTGKPIIHFYEDENDLALGILKRYPLYLAMQEKDCYLPEDREKVLTFIEQNRHSKLPFDAVLNLYKAADTRDTIEHIFGEGGAKIVFAGALIKNYVEPRDTIRLVSNVSTTKRIKFIFDFYSSGSACQQIVESKVGFVKNHGWISHDELENRFYEADAFISIAEKSGRQISSKIFEYMSYGKPILHYYYNKNDINVKYLKQYPLACCVSDDMPHEEKVEKVFEWLVSTYGMCLGSNYVGTLFPQMAPACIVDLLLGIDRTGLINY